MLRSHLHSQRAFRERKEKHVRDLEKKLNHFTSQLSTLQNDNERLQLMLQRTQTENEILKATASSSPSRDRLQFVDDPSLMPASSTRHMPASDDGPPFDPDRLANGLLSTESSSSGRPSLDTGLRLLSANATWDFLQSHPLYTSGALDISEVCERLKKKAKCDGMGPMFDADEIKAVIEEVGRSGSDELI